MGENRFMHVRLGAPSELSPPQADGETRSVEGGSMRWSSVAKQVRFTCLIPARHFCSQRCGRIMCDLLERVAVNDPYVPSITEFNDAPRG